MWEVVVLPVRTPFSLDGLRPWGSYFLSPCIPVVQIAHCFLVKGRWQRSRVSRYGATRGLAWLKCRVLIQMCVTRSGSYLNSGLTALLGQKIISQKTEQRLQRFWWLIGGLQTNWWRNQEHKPVYHPWWLLALVNSLGDCGRECCAPFVE